MPIRIFISYRRKNTIAVGIHQALMARFGADNVFFDTGSIAMGSEFKSDIQNAIECCDVFLALIGSDWLDDFKHRELIDGLDLARHEIVMALRESPPRTVIPVTIDGAKLPDRRFVPEDVRGLLDLNKYDISQDYFQRDVNDLITRIEEVESARGAGVRNAQLNALDYSQILNRSQAWRVAVPAVAVLSLAYVMTSFFRTGDAPPGAAPPPREATDVGPVTKVPTRETQFKSDTGSGQAGLRERAPPLPRMAPTLADNDRGKEQTAGPQAKDEVAEELAIRREAARKEVEELEKRTLALRRQHDQEDERILQQNQSANLRYRAEVGQHTALSGSFRAMGFDLLPNRNLTGGVVLGSHALSSVVLDIYACARRCGAIRACSGFAFQSSRTTNGHSCMLFGGSPEEIPAKDWTSGRRSYTNPAR